MNSYEISLWDWAKILKQDRLMRRFLLFTFLLLVLVGCKHNDAKTQPAQEPLPVCKDSEELVNGVCAAKVPENPVVVCEDSEELVNGVCAAKVPENPVVVCEDSEELVNGVCAAKVPENPVVVCEDSEELVNGVCVAKVPEDPLVVCEDSEELVNGVCVAKVPENPVVVCEDSEELVGGVCVAKMAVPTSCPINEKIIDGACAEIPQEELLALWSDYFVEGLSFLATSSVAKHITDASRSAVKHHMYETFDTDHESEMRCFASGVYALYYDYETDGCLERTNTFFTVVDTSYDARDSVKGQKVLYKAAEASTVVSMAIRFDGTSVISEDDVDMSNGAALTLATDNGAVNTNPFSFLTEDEQAIAQANIEDNPHNILFLASTDTSYGMQCDGIESVCVRFNEDLGGAVDTDYLGHETFASFFSQRGVDNASRGTSYGATIGGVLALMASRLFGLTRGEQALTLIKSCAVPKAGVTGLGVVSFSCLFDSEGTLKSYSDITNTTISMSELVSTFGSLALPGDIPRIRVYDQFNRSYSVRFDTLEARFVSGAPETFGKKVRVLKSFNYGIEGRGLTHSFGFKNGDFFTHGFLSLGSDFFGFKPDGAVRKRGLSVGYQKGLVTLALVNDTRRMRHRGLKAEGESLSFLFDFAFKGEKLETGFNLYISEFQKGSLFFGDTDYRISSGKKDFSTSFDISLKF